MASTPVRSSRGRDLRGATGATPSVGGRASPGGARALMPTTGASCARRSAPAGGGRRAGQPGVHAVAQGAAGGAPGGRGQCLRAPGHPDAVPSQCPGVRPGRASLPAADARSRPLLPAVARSLFGQERLSCRRRNSRRRNAKSHCRTNLECNTARAAPAAAPCCTRDVSWPGGGAPGTRRRAGPPAPLASPAAPPSAHALPETGHLSFGAGPGIPPLL